MTLSYLPFSRTVYRERSKLEERVERTRQRKNKIGSPFDFIFLSAIVDDTSPLRPRSPRLVFAPAPRLAASHPLQTRTEPRLLLAETIARVSCSNPSYLPPRFRAWWT